MSHSETYRSESGGSSIFEIRDGNDEVLVRMQRDGDLLGAWIAGWRIDNKDAIALGRWLAEAEKHDHWENQPGVWSPPAASTASERRPR